MPADPRRTVEHLVGPAGPELGCDECFDLLDTYVELEIAGAPAADQMPLLGAHLAGCSACRDDHDSLLAFIRADRGETA
jgi:hypothetical protein